MIPWVRLLRDQGREAFLHVQRKGGSEDYSLLEPELVEPSRWSTSFGRRLKHRADPDFYSAPPLREYAATMARIDPDVVVVRGLSRWFCRTAALIAKIQGRRVVVYDQEDPLPPPRSSTRLRRTVSRAAGFTCVTARVPDPHSLQRGPGFARTLPFGAPTNSAAMVRAAKQRIMTAEGPPRILMVAKYRSRKGHKRLIEALAPFASTYDFSLTFCGEEVTEADRELRREIETAVNDADLSARVAFRSGLRQSEMAQLYSQHDIFVLPSTNEPAAVSPLEAAWHGCVPLVDRRSGTRHYLPPSEDFEFDAAKPADIAAAIAPLLGDSAAMQTARLSATTHIARIAGDAEVKLALEQLVASR